jgi:hypothetical protein
MKTKTLLFFTFLLSHYIQAQNISIPDAIFKARLLSSNSNNTIAKDLNGNYFSIDANNDNQIQQIEANNVSAININAHETSNRVSDITGINSFTNLTSLDVEYNNVSNINIAGLQYLTNIDCSNNNQYLNTLILEDLPLLASLNCNGAGSNTGTPVYRFTNLPSLTILHFDSCEFPINLLDEITSLEELYGYGGYNSASAVLNLSAMPNLRIVKLDMNRLPAINFANNNIIEVLSLFSNLLTIFDKTQFSNLRELNVNWNSLSGLDVSGMETLEKLYCDVGGSFSNFTSLNVQGCTNLISLICSRNAITNLDLSNLSNLIYLDCSSNTDISTETGLQNITLKNCSSLKNVLVNNNTYLTQLDLSCSGNYNEIRVQQCENLQMINLKNEINESEMYGGTFSTYSSPNLRVICVDYDENFPFIESPIAQTPYYNFTPNCSYNIVTGNVKFDIEGDGCQNNEGIEGIKITHNDVHGESYTFSDVSGNFRIYSQANPVNLSPVNEMFTLNDYGLTAPISLSFAPGTLFQTANLCLAPQTAYNDLEINIIPLDTPRPGFSSYYKIVYKNKGNQAASGVITYSFDDTILDFEDATPAISSTSENLLQWDFSNILPFQTKEIIFSFNINSPTETPPVNGGDVLTYNTQITNTDESDRIPEDNTAAIKQTVVNSFDPNNIICHEGEAVGSDIAGKYVTYTINFENTGTADAQNIVVRNVIDIEKYEVSTLIPISSSHNVNTRVINTNEVEFIFENIELPFDDAHNDGYVTYKIRTKPTLRMGDSFASTAGIYFDYNYPIITNTYTTTIETLGVKTPEGSEQIIAFPNPVKDFLHFNKNLNIKHIEIYDISGRLLYAKENNDYRINMSSFNTSQYFLKLYTDHDIITAKILKK